MKRRSLLRAERHRDYTSGSLTRNVWQLGLPMAGSSLLFGLPSIAEGYWLGRVGSTALAAANMGMALRIVLISLVMGLSMGGQALVARHVGAGQQADADRAAQQTEGLIVVATLLLGAIGFTLAPGVLRLMGARGIILDASVDYARIIFLGLWAIELIPSMGAVMRGAGSAEWAFAVNLLAAGSVLALQSPLILGLGPLPALGVRGAAMAQAAGNVIGVVFQQYVFLSGRARVRIHLDDLQIDRHMITRILRVAVPASVERLMPNSAQTIMLGLVAVWGDLVLSGYTVASRIFSLMLQMSMGLGGAAPTLVGQNLGAEKPERAERSAWLVAAIAAGLVTALVLPVAIAAPHVIAVFNSDPNVIAVAVGCVRIMAVGQLFLALASVIGMALRGAGDTVSPMLISTGTLWLVQIPLAYALPRIAGWQTLGLWAALAVTPIVTATALCLRFRQGRWKTIRI